MEQRYCNECETPLIIGTTWSYYLQRNTKYVCKPCNNIKHKKYNDARRATYTDEQKQKATEAMREWRENNPTRYKALNKKLNSKRKTTPSVQEKLCEAAPENPTARIDPVLD